MRFYYSTQSFLAWCLNRHFYDDVHYVYVAPFYPYRLPNPKSSNPLEIYKDLYQPWADRDEFDNFITIHRIKLKKGIVAKESEGVVDGDTAQRLLNICDHVSVKFLYPIIYRVDIEAVGDWRLHKAGSGLLESDEYLIRDLGGDEFDLLFYDEHVDEDRLDLNLVYELEPGDPVTAMEILRSHAYRSPV
ncbi:MAG TPA: hypothetical protein VF746_31125 [Longimicrobium sp.]|jgi:hypothetical protein